MSHRPSSLFRLSTKAFSVGLCISSASRGWSNACIFVFCGEKNDFPKTSSRKKRAQLEKTKLLPSLSLLMLLLLLWLLQLFSFLPTLLLSCDIHIEIDIFFTQMFTQEWLLDFWCFGIILGTFWRVDIPFDTRKKPTMDLIPKITHWQRLFAD